MNLHSLLFEKRQLKLLSLLFAAMLWCFVTLEIPGEMELPLKVVFVNPPGLAVGEVSVHQLRARVSGPRILLLRQRLRGVEARVDLAGTQAGTVTIGGLERFIELVEGIRPVQILPGSLTVTLKTVK